MKVHMDHYKYNDQYQPNLEINECIFVQNMGTYTISSSSGNFNGFRPTNKFKYIYKNNIKV